MRVLEILLSKEQRDKGLSQEEKKEVGLLKKQIDQYIDAISKPGTTPAQRASLHKKMTTAVAEVKKITEGRIDELFNKSIPWEWIKQDNYLDKARFEINGLEYIVYIQSGDNIVTIEFVSNKIGDKGITGELGITGQSIKDNGESNSSTIFSTVIDIIKAYLSDHKQEIRVIEFSADEANRQQLYQSMVKRLLPSWKMSIDDGYFTLTNPNFNRPVMEAVYKVPLTEEDFDAIKDMMEKPIPAAMSLIYLQEVIIDDELNDMLKSLEDSEPNRDVRPLIAEWVHRVMPDQLWRFGIGEQTEKQKMGILSPLHGYDPHMYKGQSTESSGNAYGFR